MFENQSTDVADAPEGERRCQGKTRARKPCRAVPPKGELYCHQHGPEDAGDARDAGEQTEEPKRSQATLLVETAEQVGIELFHTDTHDAYAIIKVAEHRETWPVKAKPFRRWLSRLFYERHSKAPGSQAVQDALGVLEGTALFEGDERSVAVRVAELGGAIWLDLANDAWEAVEITAGGWRVVDDPPVRFRRPAGIRPLPTPQTGGTLADLRRFCNVDDDWPLVLGYLVAALRPTGPYPILNLLGVQGSAKTTTGRVLRDLVDPVKAGLRAAPRDERDLAIAAANAHLVGYDNLSKIDTWLSDGLCRLATGGGFATRELYSDDEETLFDFQRPVILTGIEELAVRGDLADRSLLLDLPAIGDSDRQAEEAFWADYEQARPRLLGALLDAASMALRRLPEVKLDRLPRLADFALWVVAAEPAFDLEAFDMKPGAFLAAYEGNRAAANAMAVEASPAASAVHQFATAQGSWAGTATDLLNALNKHADGNVDRRARSWPKSAKALSDTLRRAQPNLAKVNVRVTFSQSHHPRTIELEWVGDPASPASPASHQAPEQGTLGDAGGTQGRSGDAPPEPASLPHTRSDLRKQPGGDAGDAGDAAAATSSNGQRVYRCDRCEHRITAPDDMAGFPHICADAERGHFQPAKATP